MKLKIIEHFVLRCQIPDNTKFPVAAFVTEGSLILRVHTDDGHVGIGEVSPYGAPMAEIRQVLVDELVPAWVGCDPLDDDLLRQPESGYGYGNIGRNALIAGLSQALWDIRGKVSGQPVYKLINPNATGDVECYASAGMWYQDSAPDLVIEEALHWQAQGFSAYKLRPETPLNASGHFARNTSPPPVNVTKLIQLLQDIHLATKGQIRLLVDAGCRLTFAQACSLCSAMEELNCMFLEEPLPRDPYIYAELRNQTSVPLASGESLTSVAQFMPWIERNALDYLQPDANLAGIYEILKLNDVAETVGLPIVMHNWANDVSNAANVHLAAALACSPMVEYNLTTNPIRGRLAKPTISPHNGRFKLTDAPGLGIELDQELLEQFAIK